MSTNNKTNDVISQYYSSIREYLSSRDDASIEVALRLLCGLMSRGYNLSQFAPLVAQHVINEKDEVEILAQMLMLQLASSDNEACLQAVNSLYTATQSPKEARRLRAMKTITNLNHPDLVQIIDNLLQNGMSDESQYVRKATLVGSAKLVKLSEQKRPSVKKLLINALDSGDPIVISGAIYAAEMIDEINIIINSSEKLWPIMLSLDPWTQSRVLHHLRQSQKTSMKSIISILLHSQNASVVIEACQYFIDEPETIIQPLIRLLYSPPVISVHSFVLLEKISEKYPKSLSNFANHFLPPQQSEHAEHLSVKILGNIGLNCSSEFLLKWALNCNNSFAAHYIGKISSIESLKILLDKAQKPIAEISAFYTAKIINENNNDVLLSSLLELNGPKSPVVAVFSDTCLKHFELGKAMIQLLLEKFNNLNRDVKNEGSLLAARLFEAHNLEIGLTYLEKCLNDNNQDVIKRAKILDMMIKSENIKKTVWATRDPPPPSPPVIFIPELK